MTPLAEAGTAVPMMTWGALSDAGDIVRDPNIPGDSNLQRSLKQPMVVKPLAKMGCLESLLSLQGSQLKNGLLAKRRNGGCHGDLYGGI